MMLGLFFCCSQESKAKPADEVLSNPAVEFSLRDTKGKKQKLSDYKGEVVLINFWATWCAPCIQEMPHLQKIYEDLKSEGFVVLGISLDEPRHYSAIGPLAKKIGVKYPILLDRNSAVMRVYNPTMALPYSVIIGRDGSIYAYFEGYYPGKENEIRKAVEETLEQQ